MRLLDIISENSTHKDAVLDLLTIMAGEGLDRIPLSVLSGSLAIVRNIKDGVAFFNTDSDQSHNTDLPDPKASKDQVSKLAKKQVDKEMKK